MSWMNDIVKARPTLSHVDDSVEDNFELYCSFLRARSSRTGTVCGISEDVFFDDCRHGIIQI